MLIKDIKTEGIMMQQCKTCKKYKGDCGNHFKDEFNHIDFDIPSECACDQYGNCVSFEETRTKYQIALTNILENESKIKMYVNTQALIEALTRVINEDKK